MSSTLNFDQDNNFSGILGPQSSAPIIICPKPTNSNHLDIDFSNFTSTSTSNTSTSNSPSPQHSNNSPSQTNTLSNTTTPHQTPNISPISSPNTSPPPKTRLLSSIYSKTQAMPLNFQALTVQTNSLVEPTFFTNTSKDMNWVNAMNDEFNTLIQNQTWTLVLRPAHTKPIEYKWIFQLKYHLDGTIERYKTQLVVKGFNQ